MLEGISQEVLEELLTCFLEEACEILSHAESCILKLENSPNDPNCIQEIFRAMHTVKGSAASIGLSEMSTFTHAIENILSQVKLGRKVTPVLISLLLRCIDALRQWFDAIKAKKGDTFSAADILNDIKNLDVEEIKFNSSDVVKSQTNFINAQAGDIIFTEDLDLGPDTSTELKKQPISAPETPHPEENSDANLNELVTLPLSKIEALLDLFGEQVILHSSLENIKDLHNNTDRAKKIIDQLSKITYQLQNAAMSLRMVSLKAFFIKMQRAARETAGKLNKKINLEMHGEETELDKHMVDKLSGFVTHIVRNSIDHGLEEPDIRKQRNKPSDGNVLIKASIQGGFFYLEIRDDGQGINRKKVLDKAIKAGIVKESDNLSDESIINLIFHSGFSTKEQASEISGRGFGMDIVQHEVSRMHGSIKLESVENEFMKIVIRLPLTMAIFNGIVVRVGEERFIIPSSEVQDICRVPADRLLQVNPKEMLVELKEKIIPLIPLAQAINIAKNSHNQSKIDHVNTDKGTPKEMGVALEVMHRNRYFALWVNELIGLQRIVLKNLGKELKNFPGISGGAVLADGSVALVIETEKVIDLYEKHVKY